MDRRADLSFAYLIASVAVCTALVGALAEAILTVSRKPVWAQPRRRLSAVTTRERRTQSLPFIGADRRRKAETELAEQDKLAA